MTLAKLKGENVRDCAKTADNLLLQLERDDQLPSTHLLDIVDHLSACSVMDFKIHWMHKRTQVEEFVKETLGKDKAAIASLPTPEISWRMPSPSLSTCNTSGALLPTPKSKPCLDKSKPCKPNSINWIKS